jgi:hypothetical protein
MVLGLTALALTTGNLAAAAEKKALPPSEIIEKRGNLEFKYNCDDGVRLYAFGIPVIKSSSFNVIWPHWQGVFYSPGDDNSLVSRAEIKKTGDKTEIVLHHKWLYLTDNKGEGTEIFTLTDQNVYSHHFEFTFSNYSQKAYFEWCPGQFYATSFLGREYQIKQASGLSKKIFPFQAEGEIFSTEKEYTLGKNFEWIKANTSFGPLEIQVEKPSDDFIWMDYRKLDWAWPGSPPLFWLWSTSKEVENGKKYEMGITLRFPAKCEKAAESVPVIKTVADIKEESAAMVPHQDPITVVPLPKEINWTGELFPLTNKTQVYIGKNPTPQILNAVEFLMTELKEKYQVTPEVIQDDIPHNPSPDGNAILLGELARFQAPARICARARLGVPTEKEGYSLLVNPKQALVAGRTGKGLFYGITSLVQLVKVDENGVYLKGVRIRDYPTLEFRGIHTYTAKGQGDEQARAVRDLMARYKINSMVWNCEAIIWDKHPELANKFVGMEKADAQKVVDAGKKYNVDIIPCIPALGHADWMFWNNQNNDLLEDTTRRNSYCPDNPKSYELLFDVYEEAIKMFGSKYFHISECEIWLDGQTPCKEIKARTGKNNMEIILQDQQTIADWFKKKNVTPMLWGDLFLYVGESPDATNATDSAQAVRDRQALPREYIVTDWHYQPAAPEAYKSIDLFQKAGHKVIGATWYLPNDIRSFNLECINKKAMGTLQTTWAGFSPNITKDVQNWHQFWAYIMAAHYAWSGDKTLTEDLPFDNAQMFIDNWLGKKPLLAPKKGFSVELTGLYNRKLADDTSFSGWVGYGPTLDMSACPTGKVVLEETAFTIKPNAKNQAALMLAGSQNPQGKYPESVVLDLKGETASELHFLMTTGFRENDKTPIGAIVITYQDGTSDTVKLVYGESLWAFNDTRIAQKPESLKTGRIAWKKKSASGDYVSLRDVVWTNPQPEKKIQSVTLTSAHTVANPILLAITGVR